MIKSRCLREFASKCWNLIGKDSQRCVLNVALLTDDKGGISIVSERAQQRLRNLAVALVVAGGERAVMHDDTTHGRMLAVERTFNSAPNVLCLRPTSGRAIVVVVGEQA